MRVFDFEGSFVEQLVRDAVEIVQTLVDNNEFFLHTFGSVLRQIAGLSLLVKSNITDEDIFEIRAKLQCTVSTIACLSRSYMECDPDNLEVYINALVQSISGLLLHDCFAHLFFTCSVGCRIKARKQTQEETVLRDCIAT